MAKNIQCEKKRQNFMRIIVLSIMFILISIVFCLGLTFLEKIFLPNNQIGVLINDRQTSTLQSQSTTNDGWKLLLVNKWNSIPKDYEIPLMSSKKRKKKKLQVVCYMRVATREQLDEKEQDLRVFSKMHDYEITDFVIEQRSGLAACSKTLNELLHNQSVRNILTPNISGLSRNISVLQGILRTAEKKNKNIISTDGSCEAYPLY